MQEHQSVIYYITGVLTGDSLNSSLDMILQMYYRIPGISNGGEQIQDLRTWVTDRNFVISTLFYVQKV